MLQAQSSCLLLNACSLLQKSLLQHVVAAVSTPAAQTVQTIPTAAAGSMLQQQRCKHDVRMVLLKNHKKLGKKGDLIEVKSGYARATLFPEGTADYAVPSVIEKLKAEGFLSAQGLEMLRSGFKRQGRAGPTDPCTLPHEQQMPRILRLLSENGVIVCRKFDFRKPEEPMIGTVTPHHLVHAVAQQHKVDLPPELVMMRTEEPIKNFGTFRVPLNLKTKSGEQAELAVTVKKTRRSSRVRQLRQRYLLFTGQQAVQQEARQAQA